MAAVPLEVDIRYPHTPPTYQLLAPRAGQMRQRGLSVAAIARHLGVAHRTADKAVRWSWGH